MQCNQAFCGNGFPNGPFCSSYSTPLQSNQSMYPEIVGEGQVTSMTLPDGSVQFFFMPTIKWRSPNANQCCPFATAPNPMFANTNYSMPPQCNNNVGSWFIRSFLPFPQNMCNPPCQRNEFLKQSNTTNTDFTHNLNCLDFGYQVKFHNDAWSSTTDLVYFYPSLRKRDFVCTLPCKDKTVQIDTGPVANNTVCHYELVCSKPCNCSCSAPAAPMSLECLVDPKLTSKNNNNSDDSCCSKQNNKRSKDKNNTQKKSKNIMWACDSTGNILSVDKSITTYADESCDCSPAGGRETQTIRSCCDVDTKPMDKALLKPKWTAKSYICDTSDVSECSCDEKSNKRSQHSMKAKPMNTAPLKSRTAKCYSGDSMTEECSCDDHSKISKKRVTKRRKPKCDCGCESRNSVGGKTGANKDGRGTPYSNTCSTCSINCCTSVSKFKYSPKNATRKPSNEQKISLEQEHSDNVCSDCEPKDEEMREPICPSSEKLLESSAHSLDTNCLDCDNVATTCDGSKCE